MTVSSSRPAAKIPRVMPAVTETNEHFWRGGAEGVLVFLRCDDCGYYIHPPAPVCRRCRSRSVNPSAVSGKGEVLTFAINRHTWVEGFDEPYVVALVGLVEDDDLRFTTNVVGCPVEDVYIGMPVEVEFEQLEDVWVPIFHPAEVDA